MKTTLRFSTLAACLFTALISYAQYVQVGSKLLPNGAEGNTAFGSSVALSADSSTMVVGAVSAYTYANTGAVSIYVRSGNNWAKQADLFGSGAVAPSHQGHSVAISADGNTILIGAPFDNDSLGATWVFVRSGSTWTEQAKLVSNNTNSFAMQGYSVSLSYDGNTALIGAPRDNDSTGCAIVFVRNGTAWSEQSKLVGTGGVGNPWQGRTVSLTANGNRAVVLGPADNNFTGAVWTFNRSGNIWAQSGSKLANLHGGYSFSETGLSISGDGTRIAVGAPSANNYGGVDLFQYNSGSWQLLQTLYSTNYINGSQNSQGEYTALSYDGKTLAFSGPRAYSSGKTYGYAYLWRDSASVFVESFASYSLVGLNYQPSKIQAVSLSASGGMAAFGAPRFETNNGGAWIYINNGSNVWTCQSGMLMNTSLGGPGLFGYSVAMDAAGTKIIAGAATDNGDRGAYWTFAKNGNNWTQQGAKTKVNFSGSGTYFGNNVSLSADGKTSATNAYGGWVFFPSKVGFWIHGDSTTYWGPQAGPLHPDSGFNYFFGLGGAAISADGNTAVFANADESNDSGYIYIYVRSGNNWVQQGPRLRGAKGNHQGTTTSVSSDGNVAVWGTYGDTVAYVYRRTAGIWQQEAMLNAGNSSGNPVTGSFVAISADAGTIAIGVPADSLFGAVFIYRYNGAQWVREAKLRPGGVTVNQRFGNRVALSADGNLMVGGNDIWSQNNNGGAWVFKRNGTTWSQFTNKLLPNDETGTSYFGSSVAMSANGSVLAIGGRNDDGGRGAVWIFSYNGLQVNTTAVVNATCNNTTDGKIIVQASGGTTPYQFHWSNGSSSADSLVNLSTGAYGLTVYDANGDSATALFNVGVSGTIQTSTTYKSICNSADTGFVAVQPSGGTSPYQYAWNIPQQTDSILTGLSTGTYFYTVTDAAGCAVSGNITIPYNSFWSSVYTTEEQCGHSDGGGIIYAQGGAAPYTYLWGTTPVQTTQMAQGLSSGVYNFTVTDNEGCFTTGNATVTASCGNVVQGTVYVDANNNCQYDNGETVLSGYLVSGVTTSGSAYCNTDMQGHYTLLLPPGGSTQVSLIGNGSGCTLNSNCPIQNVAVNFGTAPDTVSNFNLGIQLPTDYNLHITGWIGGGIPGGTINMSGNFSNLGTPAFAGTATVTMVHDAALTLLSTSPAYTSYNATTHTITWQVTNNALGWTYLNSVSATLGIPAGFVLGNSVSADWHIEPTQNDCETGNNNYHCSRIINGSYDPNFKECTPDSFITLNDSILTYTIHFQNTGTDTTHFITLRDTLSANVDPATVMDLGASHQPYSFNLSKNGILTWYFDPIALPDSTTDPINSQGFVRYSVKVKDGLPNGTMVTNRASIYFDYNGPVLTNTTVNLVNKSVGITEVLSCVNVKVYPNPLNDYCLFTVNGFEGAYTLEIFDVTARKVFEQQQIGTNLYRFNRKALAAGTYIYKITDTNGNSAVGKVSME